MKVRMPLKRAGEWLSLLLSIVIVMQLILSVFIYRHVRALRTEGIKVVVNPVQNEEEGLSIGELAPDFTALDASGNNISLADFEGKRVILIFSSPTCSHCKDLYDDLKVYDNHYRDSQTALLMLSLSSEEENRRLKVQEGFAFPVLALTREIVENYRVSGTPFLFLIDPEGRIQNKGVISSLDQLIAFAHK